MKVLQSFTACVCKVRWFCILGGQHVDLFLRELMWQARGRCRDQRDMFIERHRSALATQRVWLRSQLQRTPWWALGHLSLGFVELRLQALADERPRPKSLETIQVSAQAALVLHNRSHAPLTTRIQLEAEYLLAMLLFLRKDFEEALRGFQKILSPRTAGLLSEKVYFEALENAGASAMAVSDKQQALAFFLAIPQHALTKEACTAIEFLQGTAV